MNPAVFAVLKELNTLTEPRLFGSDTVATSIFVGNLTIDISWV